MKYKVIKDKREKKEKNIDKDIDKLSLELKSRLSVLNTGTKNSIPV